MRLTQVLLTLEPVPEGVRRGSRGPACASRRRAPFQGASLATSAFPAVGDMCPSHGRNGWNNGRGPRRASAGPDAAARPGDGAINPSRTSPTLIAERPGRGVRATAWRAGGLGWGSSWPGRDMWLLLLVLLGRGAQRRWARDHLPRLLWRLGDRFAEADVLATGFPQGVGRSGGGATPRSSEMSRKTVSSAGSSPRK